MTVRPTAADAAALVSFDPPGLRRRRRHGEDRGRGASAERQARALAQQLPHGRARRRLHRRKGSSASASPAASTTRRCSPATRLRALLDRLGHRGGRRRETGRRAEQDAARLAPLAPALDAALRARQGERQLLRRDGLEDARRRAKGRPGKSGDGADVVVKYLEGHRRLRRGTVIKNGSGLYDANRVTALETVKLLRAAYRDPAISLGVRRAARDRRRRRHAAQALSRAEDKRALRAKTGTLEADRRALAATCSAPPGKSPLAFSILVNNVAGKVTGSAAPRSDKCVDAIVAPPLARRGRARRASARRSCRLHQRRPREHLSSDACGFRSRASACGSCRAPAPAAGGCARATGCTCRRSPSA